MLQKASELLGEDKIGIYSNNQLWDVVMCNYMGLNSYKLWWQHYDNRKSFSNFVPFGGWDKPTLKQYAGNVERCGTLIDRDYSESFDGMVFK